MLGRFFKDQYTYSKFFIKNECMLPGRNPYTGNFRLKDNSAIRTSEQRAAILQSGNREHSSFPATPKRVKQSNPPL